MKITPVDIEQQQFRVKLRGFDMAEVSAFLDLVAQEMDALVRENIDLKEEIKRLRGEVESFHGKERMINDTMINCQGIVSDLKANAQKEAENIVATAQLEADRLLGDASSRLVRLKEEILDAKKSKIQFQSALKSMVESHLRMLSFEEREENE